MNLIAIDPGKHAVGWAAFGDDGLSACGMLEIGALGYLAGRRPDVAVIEVPQIYDRRRWKGDPNDLIDVAIAAGMARQALCDAAEVVLVKPAAWKGQRAKAIDTEYTSGLLSLPERAVIDRCGVAKSKRHNVIDAIGIGLWRLGRR